jgi:hypothetical protein
MKDYDSTKPRLVTGGAGAMMSGNGRYNPHITQFYAIGDMQHSRWFNRCI